MVARYGSDPAAQDVVKKARDKIADGLLQAGRYQAVIDSFPQTNAAKEAMDKLADQMVQEGRYQEIIDKYPNTSAAQKCALGTEKARADTTRVAPGPWAAAIPDRGTTGTTGDTRVAQYRPRRPNSTAS